MRMTAMLIVHMSVVMMGGAVRLIMAMVVTAFAMGLMRMVVVVMSVIVVTIMSVRSIR